MKIDMKESEKTIAILANKMMRRVTALGVPAHVAPDIKQEMWIAWCVARDTFDPQQGCSFKTYLWNGALLHMRTWIRKNVSQRHAELFAKSIEGSIGEDDDGASLESVLPSADPTPDQVVIADNVWQHAMRRLQPRARQFMELLRSQPDELVSEANKIRARTEHGRVTGNRSVVEGGVSTRLIFDLMGASKPERLKIAREVNDLAKRMHGKAA